MSLWRIDVYNRLGSMHDGHIYRPLLPVLVCLLWSFGTSGRPQETHMITLSHSPSSNNSMPHLAIFYRRHSQRGPRCLAGYWDGHSQVLGRVTEGRYS